MARQKWTKERVLDEIRGLHQQSGRINAAFVRSLGKHPLYQASLRYFGGWGLAVTKAGFNYAEITGKHPIYRWPKEKVIESIRQFFLAHGDVSQVYVLNHDPRLVSAGRKRFRGWKHAIEAAGLDYQKISRYSQYQQRTRKTILKEIRERNANGLSIHPGHVCKLNPALYVAARRYFGSYREAVRRAGFGDLDDPKRIWTKATVTQKLQSLRLAGKPINTASLQLNGYGGLIDAACRLFGSFRNAIEATGLDYSDIVLLRINYWSKKRVVAEIRRMRRAEEELSCASAKESHPDLQAAAVRRFGTWQTAVEAAGIDYLRYCKIWSTKAWLRRLNKSDARELQVRTDMLIVRHNKNKRRHV